VIEITGLFQKTGKDHTRRFRDFFFARFVIAKARVFAGLIFWLQNNTFRDLRRK
jgi:hypothetical protein